MDNQNRPVPHPGIPDDDPLEAETQSEAVIIDQWGENKAVAMGDESAEEWIIADDALELDWTR